MAGKKPSKILRSLEREDDRISEYEFDPDNDMGAHWLHLEWPYVDDSGSGSIHENTVADCLYELRHVRKSEED